MSRGISPGNFNGGNFFKPFVESREHILRPKRAHSTRIGRREPVVRHIVHAVDVSDATLKPGIVQVHSSLTLAHETPTATVSGPVRYRREQAWIESLPNGVESRRINRKASSWLWPSPSSARECSSQAWSCSRLKVCLHRLAGGTKGRKLRTNEPPNEQTCTHHRHTPAHPPTGSLASTGMTGMLGLFFCGLLALIPGIYYSRITWLLLRNRADGYVSWEDVPSVS